MHRVYEDAGIDVGRVQGRCFIEAAMKKKDIIDQFDIETLGTLLARICDVLMANRTCSASAARIL